jgi:SAM-dependent methyltransferase
MPPATPPPTFRDPAGSLILNDTHALRTIRGDASAAVQEFLASPLRERLESDGDMVATTLVEPERNDAPLQLRHPRIAIITYPWEWTPGQWLAAAELTLTLCEEALDNGWILKDATPLNILFVGPRPVLVDVLSFERHAPGNSIWLAYGQYMRTFLLPLLLNRLLHWPLSLTLFKRDGYEPAELYTALSWPQRLSLAALFPITLPALLEKRNGGAAQARAAAKDPGLALHILRGTLRGLRRRTRKALPRSASSKWSDYTATLTHYTVQESAEKLTFVREVLEGLRPERVLDIGANTGEFSVLAASLGASVVALERDAAAADRLFRRAQAQQLDILAVHADLARPSPAAGWENAESLPLLERLEGRFDVVLMLAVIHHLLLMEQVPLQRIVELLHRMTRRYLVLEWVPATDPMFQSLLRGRDGLYGNLSENDLLQACEGRFRSLRRLALGNGRVLFLLEKAAA